VTIRIAYATAPAIPDGDEDAPLLAAALAARGASCEPTVWDDAVVDWAAFDMVVLRSTWDYSLRLPEFLDWAARICEVTRLANPEPVVRWNTDKRYLAELHAAGIPIVPTGWSSPGGSTALPGGDFVVKPAVSAGARDTQRYTSAEHDRARAHVAALHADGRHVMVQPYVDAVDEAGETALLFVGGAYSHAIRKGPLLRRGDALVTGLYAPEEISQRAPDPAEVALGDRVLAALPFAAADLLYARVDLLPGPDGPVVIEVELTEPSLFLAHGESRDPAGRLADAILERLGHPTAAAGGGQTTAARP
jgi:glutathione synthase/RimK-type ligase-like ATP-grasp enzyme